MLETDKGSDLQRWERDNQVVLGKMGALLRVLWWRVKELSREGVERVGLVCEGDGAGSSSGGGLKAGLYRVVGDGGEGGLLPNVL